MRLINPTTKGLVETATDEATAFLISKGFKPVEQPKKKPARKRSTAKTKEQ